MPPVPDDLDVKGFAAAAAALFIGIAEDEARLQLLLDVIHFGANDEEGGLWIDQQGDAVLLHRLVARSALIGELQRVAEARAALGPHANANAGGGFAPAIQHSAA